MADIIERLRIESQREPNKPIWRDAIDEIEALRAQLDEQCRLHAIGMERELALITERDRLRVEVERLRGIVRPKREKECLTLDDWRTRAYYLEANWSRCSRACAVEQTKRERAEARAERLAEALRDAATSMQAIADKAGRDEYLMTIDEVRCYANSRASAARAALEQEE